MGGGSISFGVGATTVLASDSNDELIHFYEQCRDNIAELLSEIRMLSDDPTVYYAVRSRLGLSGASRAARFYYLNRTSYMGLYRTNQQGIFNVPYGGGDRLNHEKAESQLGELSSRMKRATVAVSDFRETLSKVQPGDFVVLDPPYGHSGDTPFRRYGREVFSQRDHQDLAEKSLALAETDATVLATLPYDPRVLTLYRDWRVILTRTNSSGKILEVGVSPDALAVTKPGARIGWNPAQNSSRNRSHPPYFWKNLGL